MIIAVYACWGRVASRPTKSRTAATRTPVLSGGGGSSGTVGGVSDNAFDEGVTDRGVAGGFSTGRLNASIRRSRV